MMKTGSAFARLAKAFFQVVIVLIATCAIAAAQETAAAVQGTVTDPSGAVVPDATVTATSDALIKPASTRTDSKGFYRINALPPGNYVVTVTGGGMSAKATNLNLAAGDLPNLNISLTASGTEAVIDVSASVAIVDVTQSKVETVISNDVLQQIPKGRSFQSVIAFAPGARQEPLQSLSPSATGAAISPLLNGARTNGYQIDGASDAENIYMLEGVNITGIQGGGSGTGVGGTAGFNVPNDFVQEVSVKSSSFEAEFGGAMGGVINVVSQRGANNWHGSIFMYYRSSAFNANDQCGFNYTAMCGLRLNPDTPANSGARTDGAAQYYIAKQDHYKIVEPGFRVGGPLLRDKLNLFASFVPQYYRARRTVNFTKTNPGPRDFYTSQDTDYAFARLDYAPFSKLRLFAAWENSYARLVGSSLPQPDSKIGQTNATAGNDPATSYRSDTGTVNPASVYIFGGDYVITPRLLLSARYGYTYSNSGDRGKPIGIQYLYQTSAVADTPTKPGTTTLSGQTFTQAGVPATFLQSSGFQNISSNLQNLFNKFQRKQFNIDLSYLKTGWVGTHNFKGGYSRVSVVNDVLSGYNTAQVQLYYGQDYVPGTGAAACAAVIATNVSRYGANGNHCRGNFGYFVVNDGVENAGTARGNNSSFYFQDQWQIGHTGITLNPGVRFDSEYLPPYNPGASSISFGFGDKVAPRIGGAYDVLHNGKLKAYASFGWFYDIIKYSLPSGSFGGQYWHQCAYAWDDYNYNSITPTSPNKHGCPTDGPAPGVTVGTFIENLDLRKNIINTQDPGVDPNVKPMKKHEFIVGSDWAITPTMSFSARYARNRLDNTIEDIGASDSLGFYIGNPGPGYGDLLHRPLLADGLTAPLCPSCPVQPKATRNYDGLELRFSKSVGSRWFVNAFYTYSRLRGNYPGLTSTNITDGSGGRQSPNNNRSFDQPQMQFTAHGKPFGGPLPTDRPNTFQMFGTYRRSWFHMESTVGLSQSIFQGTPVSTCWPTLTSTSSCQFVEDQGNFVNLHRGANGDVVVDSITYGKRTPVFTQTSLNLTHYVKVSSDHENRRFGGEVNFYNIFNQHAVTSIYNQPITTATAPTDTTNPTNFDYKSLLSGWDYVAISNSPGGGPNNQVPQLKTVSSRYGLPALFQSARQIQFKIAYIF